MCIFVRRMTGSKSVLQAITKAFICQAKCGRPLFFRSYTSNKPSSKDIKFTKNHEWVSIDRNNIVTIGISDYAQQNLGDIVYVQLPEIGTKLKQNDECGIIESVKSASEIYAPVTCQVTEKNTDVEHSSKLINTSCYDQGWLFKASLDVNQSNELNNLMSEDAYHSFLSEDNH